MLLPEIPDPTTNSFLPSSEEDTLALDEFVGASMSSSYTTTTMTSSPTWVEWSSEDVAKGLQDYLICIEMFVAASVHLFVFPHTEYDDPQVVEARAQALNHQRPHKDWNKRLGRKWKEWDNKSGWSGSTTNISSEMEMMVLPHSASAAASASNSKNTKTSDGLSEVLYNRTQTESGGVDDDDLRIRSFDSLILWSAIFVWVCHSRPLMCVTAYCLHRLPYKMSVRH
jgi:hypothetical protein